MFDRNDVDFRITKHLEQIEAINRGDWQSASKPRPASVLRRVPGAVLAALVAGLYSGSLAT